MKISRKLLINNNLTRSGWLLEGNIMKENILKIMNLAKTEMWPFPKTFDQLQEIGVVSYEVLWDNGYSSQFNLIDGSSFVENKILNFDQLKVSEVFSANDAKTALLIHQQGKTSYVQWIEDMASAGVSYYIVKMSDRTVSYFNSNRTQSIIELVPINEVK